MPKKIHECQCAVCREGKENAVRELHHQMNVYLSRLDERQRRWYVALESKRIGRGGDSELSRITGMNVETIRRGRREVDAGLDTQPSDRIRAVGGGRRPAEKKR